MRGKKRKKLEQRNKGTENEGDEKSKQVSVKMKMLSEKHMLVGAV